MPRDSSMDGEQPPKTSLVDTVGWGALRGRRVWGSGRRNGFWTQQVHTDERSESSFNMGLMCPWWTSCFLVNLSYILNNKGEKQGEEKNKMEWPWGLSSKRGAIAKLLVMRREHALSCNLWHLYNVNTRSGRHGSFWQGLLRVLCDALSDSLHSSSTTK